MYGTSLSGCVLLLVLAVCWYSTARADSDRYIQVEAWTGSYRANVSATSNRKVDMTGNLNPWGSLDALKEQQIVNAQVILDEKKVSRRRVTWEGTATCNVSGTYYGKSSMRDTPFWMEESGSDSRMFTTPAKLVIHTTKDKYTISLCRMAFTYKTSRTGVGVNDQGGIVPVSEAGGHKLNPGVFFHSELMPEGPVPQQGFHLMGSLDIDGHPADPAARALTAHLMTGMDVTGKVQWSFTPDLCSDTDKNYKVRITMPSEPIELIYKNRELSELFYAEPVPNENDLRSKVVWQAFEIDDSTRVADPENFNSDYLNLTFKGIPDHNEAFGEKEISATLGSLERCTDAARNKVTVFFEQEGNDNGSDDPNWMWYWLQTSAGKKYESFIRLGDSEICEDSLGYFIHIYPDIFFICEEVLRSRPADPFKLLVGKKLRSIDIFAIVAIHENKHMENHQEWWAHVPRDQWPGRENQIDVDHDGDTVPDDVELRDEMSQAGYDPLDWDSFNIGFSDSEVSAYKTADQWAVGSADEEDWACPGAQGQEECKEVSR